MLLKFLMIMYYVSALFLLLNWRHSHLPKEISFNMLLMCKMGTTVPLSNGFSSVLQNDVFSVIFDYFFFFFNLLHPDSFTLRMSESGHCFFFSVAHKVYNEKVQWSPLSLSIHNNQFFQLFPTVSIFLYNRLIFQFLGLRIYQPLGSVQHQIFSVYLAFIYYLLPHSK